MKHAFLLGLMLLPAALVSQQAKRCVPQLVHVDNQWRRDSTFGNNSTNYFGGHVRFRCVGQNVQIGSDSLQVINDNVYVLMGHAFYRDTSLEVLADTLTYYVKSPNRMQDETILARLNVKVTDRKSGSTMTGPSVDYMRAAKGLRDSDDVVAGARPLVRYLPTITGRGAAAPKPWTITADHLHGFGQSRLWGGGTVVVIRDSLKVNSDSLDVDSGKNQTAKFLGKPAVLKQGGTDSLQIHGSLIRLGFVTDTLRTVRAFGDGEVIRGTSTMSGDSLLLGLEHEKVIRADIWGKSGRSRLRSGGYYAEADSLVLETPGGQLRGLRAFGKGLLENPRDSLHPVVIDSAEGGSPGRDRLRGNRIIAQFEDRDSAGTVVSRISRVQAFGAAQSQYAYNAGKQGENCPTLTYFTADTIIVHMKSGDSTGVADVRYHGNVVGYLAEKASTTTPSKDASPSHNACRARK